MTNEYQKVRELLSKYLDGKTSLEEEEQLFHFFASDEVPEEFIKFKPEFVHYLEFRKKSPEHIILSNITNSTKEYRMIRTNNLLKIAAMVILMLGSFYIGTSVVQKEPDHLSQVDELKAELKELKYEMAGRLITEESSHEKIQGLMLVNDNKLDSNDIISDILNIYEYDSSPIVRSMALDFLKNHVKNDEVRNTMIGVISKDDLVQIQLETIMMIKELNDEDLLLRINHLIDDGLLQEKLKLEMEEIL